MVNRILLDREQQKKLLTYRRKLEIKKNMEMQKKKAVAKEKRLKKVELNLKKKQVDYQLKKQIQAYKVKKAKAIAKARLEFLTQTATQRASNIQQQAQQRKRIIGVFGSRAEQLEIAAVRFNEIPMLRDMERQRMILGSPDNKFLMDTEKAVTDSFPS